MAKKIQTKIRKKADLVEKEEKEKEQVKPEVNEEDEDWKEHWKKEQNPDKPKRLGGGRRPRPFKINYSEEE